VLAGARQAGTFSRACRCARREGGEGRRNPAGRGEVKGGSRGRWRGRAGGGMVLGGHLGLVEGGVLVEDAGEDRVVHLVAQVAAKHAAPTAMRRW
jgi:hypothetical protein